MSKVTRRQVIQLKVIELQNFTQTMISQRDTVKNQKYTGVIQDIIISHTHTHTHIYTHTHTLQNQAVATYSDNAFSTSIKAQAVDCRQVSQGACQLS